MQKRKISLHQQGVRGICNEQDIPLLSNLLRDPRYSIFWRTQPTFDYLRGQTTKKYSVLGLEVVSNVTSTFPREADLLTAIQWHDRGAVHLTYAQVYTLFTKPLENTTPLANRPFLLTLLLGMAFISRQADLQGVRNSTEHLYECLQLIEATFLHLSREEGRLELVLCTPRIGAILSFSLQIISNQVCSRNLLLQVSPYYDIYMP